MDDFIQANQALWDQWTLEHETSPFYDVDGFRTGKDRLRSIELSELGDVSGKSMLHLQCHFGLDTLAWARRGAAVTGVDLSPTSIALAHTLSQELNIPARFLCTPLYDLPSILSDTFDIVFTSYGVLHWLPYLHRWAEIIAHFLRPGGVFYIVEDHTFFRSLRADENGQIRVGNSYFFSATPDRVEMSGSYATGAVGETRTFYIWNHPLGEVISSLLSNGLAIDFLHEFPFAARAKFPFMGQGPDGWWHLPESYAPIPFLFSLRAHKPGA